MNGSKKHIELLDYTRAVAVISVLLFHTLGSAFGAEDLPWDGWVRSFSVLPSFLCLLPFSFGQAGVAIFFVVSGFCIHLSFKQQGADWRSFWIRRFWRIYPAYIAATAFAVLFLTTNSRLSLPGSSIWPQLATHAFLVHNFSPDTFMGINGSFWSLAIEAQLYLLYPLLLLMVGKFGWRRTMVMLACCEFLIRGVDGTVQTLGTGNTVCGHISWLLAASPLGYWFSWTLGARLADSFLKNEPLPFAQIPLFPWVILTVLSYFMRPTLSFLFVLSAIVTAIAISRLLGRVRHGADAAAPGFFPSLLGKIGLWSYSIYLMHQPLLNALSVFLNNAIPGQYRPSAAAGFWYFTAGWLIVIPISGLWYHVFELPGIAVGKWLIRKRAPDSRTEMRQTAAVPVHGLKKSFYFMAGALVIAIAGILIVTTKLDERRSKKELELAEVFTAKHEYADAIGHYQSALNYDANSADALNNAAWLLATAPDPRFRDGKTAVELASRACELTDYKQPFFIGTLAAACAEAGRFDEAVANAQKARSLALSRGQMEIAGRDEQLLELYQAGQPFHETAGPN